MDAWDVGVSLISIVVKDVVADMVCVCRYLTGVHFVGSNSMMPQELGGVVSPELLVYGKLDRQIWLCQSDADSSLRSHYKGTTNLRVADASIMPISVFPHCTLGLYGVGEKAANMILQAASVV